MGLWRVFVTGFVPWCGGEEFGHAAPACEAGEDESCADESGYGEEGGVCCGAEDRADGDDRAGGDLHLSHDGQAVGVCRAEDGLAGGFPCVDAAREVEGRAMDGGELAGGAFGSLARGAVEDDSGVRVLGLEALGVEGGERDDRCVRDAFLVVLEGLSDIDQEGLVGVEPRAELVWRDLDDPGLVGVRVGRAGLLSRCVGCFVACGRHERASVGLIGCCGCLI